MLISQLVLLVLLAVLDCLAEVLALVLVVL